MCDLLTIYSVVACAVVFLWYYNRSAYSYWRKLNVKYLEPTPFLGNAGKVIIGLASWHEELDRLYKAFHNEPFGGIYQFRLPVLLVKDPELVTAILIKDFKYFPNHGYKSMFVKNKKLDPLLSHLLFTEDERWKVLRQKMSPVFSPGKLKNLHDQILDCVQFLMQNIDEQMGHNNSIDLGMKELFEKLTLDVIGSCAFGLDCRSNEQFRQMGKASFQRRFALIVRMTVNFISKRLGNYLNIPFYDKKVNDFYMNLALDTLEYRRKNGVARNDLFQLMMELQNSHVDPKFSVGGEHSKLLPDEKFDEIDIAANVFLFLIAGYATTAATLSFCVYELALNQNIQEKIRSEVESLRKKDSKLTYDMLNDMTYLDATILETLRKYPPGSFLTRQCSEDYTIPGTNVQITAGTDVLVPVWSIHHDWRNYPNPEVFDPERFLGGNKSSRPNGTFIPFGDGPRHCLGKLFAEMEIKMALAEIILKYEIKPCGKTQIPLKLTNDLGLLQVTCGIWVCLTKRK